MDAAPLAMATDPLGDGEDMRLIERLAQRGATVTGGAEMEALLRLRWFRNTRKISFDQIRGIDQLSVVEQFTPQPDRCERRRSRHDRTQRSAVFDNIKHFHLNWQ